MLFKNVFLIRLPLAPNFQPTFHRVLFCLLVYLFCEITEDCHNPLTSVTTAHSIFSITYISMHLFVLKAIFLANLIQYRRLTYEGSYHYPLWADLLGWLIVLSIILCVPAFAIKKIVSVEGDFLTVSTDCIVIVTRLLGGNTAVL